MKIKSLKAREILDSRGNKTVETVLFTENNSFRFSVPSGASTGAYEAIELRDKDGGVLNAVKNINEKILPRIKEEDVLNQEKIDKIMIELDGTENKSNLGANAILPVSICILRAAAFSYNLPLYKYIKKIFSSKDKFPLPSFNVINGGAHAGNDLDIQEFMIIPKEKSYPKNLQAGVSTYHALKNILQKKYGKGAINVGDEGGFAPLISSPKEALDAIIKASSSVKIGLDCAASYFYKNGKYSLNKKLLSKNQLIDFYKNLIKKYPIISLEDPFEENDIEGWKMIKEKIKNVEIIGDDLTVTNSKKIKEMIDNKCITGVIIKPNQIGTVTETLASIDIAVKNKLKIMVSHRSGETTDDFIADLAVGVSADYIKSGAPARGERVVKYNRLLEIWEEMYEKK